MELQIRKNSKLSDEDDDGANLFDRLPYETSLDIFSRLPINSLMQFCFACRSFNSLSRDLHLSRSHAPCLILHSNYPLRNQLHFLRLSGDDKIRNYVWTVRLVLMGRLRNRRKDQKLGYIA